MNPCSIVNASVFQRCKSSSKESRSTSWTILKASRLSLRRTLLCTGTRCNILIELFCRSTIVQNKSCQCTFVFVFSFRSRTSVCRKTTTTIETNTEQEQSSLWWLLTLSNTRCTCCTLLDRFYVQCSLGRTCCSFCICAFALAFLAHKLSSNETTGSSLSSVRIQWLSMWLVPE